MAKRRAGAEGEGSIRAKVDWKYTLFYAMFYVLLIIIALFGVVAET
ncbi:MAG: hypothetical protein HYU66_03935 [Armatimonadetes bacterium]|nr:hypothetical protein [Armatimonadota bacterium]